MGFAVKLDTNGSSPDKLRELISEEMINYIAMDIKNSPQKYHSTAGCGQLSAIDESIDIIMSSKVEYEFRTTAVNEFHDVNDFRLIGEWISGANKYYIQSYEDSGDILSPLPFSAPDTDTLNAFLNAVREKVPSAELRGI